MCSLVVDEISENHLQSLRIEESTVSSRYLVYSYSLSSCENTFSKNRNNNNSS